MASLQERSRNNVRAGVFVTLTLAAAFAVILILGEAWTWFQPRKTYKIRFPVQAGVEGLSSGSEVRVGGMPRGRVSDIRPEQETGPLQSIIVDIEVDRDVALYPDAAAFRIAPLLGNTAWINFPDVGTSAAGPALVEGAVLDAARGLGLLTTLLGPENAEAANQIVSNTEKFSGFLADARGEYEKRVVPILDSTNEAATNASDVVASVKADYVDWSAQIKRILESVVSASDKADAFMSDGRALAANISAGVDEVRALVKDNRPQIDATIDHTEAASENVRVITQRVRDEALDAAIALLERGKAGVEAFTSVMEKADIEVDALIPEIRQIAADGRLAAQQLKLATIEVRRSPWKLLYRPSTEELEHELLYESARTFAFAAGDLRAASEAFDRVLTQHGDRLAEDQEKFKALRDMLAESFDRYQKAQQRLIDVIIDDSAQP
jgi:ABC-type transporter Mla subunit MlaD